MKKEFTKLEDITNFIFNHLSDPDLSEHKFVWKKYSFQALIKNDDTDNIAKLKDLCIDVFFEEKYVNTVAIGDRWTFGFFKIWDDDEESDIKRRFTSIIKSTVHYRDSYFFCLTIDERIRLIRNVLKKTGYADSIFDFNETTNYIYDHSLVKVSIKKDAERSVQVIMLYKDGELTIPTFKYLFSIETEPAILYEIFKISNTSKKYSYEK